MKKAILLFECFLVLAACEVVDAGVGRGARGGGYSPGESGRHRDTARVADPPAAADTVVWACAVKVPDGYDWARDTAAGHFSGELILYRNSEPTLKLPAGEADCIGPAPGSHHLAGGHLYTEFASGGQTVVLRDGAPYLQLGGAGILKGILPWKDGSTLTLFCSLPDGGLQLHRDSGLLLKISRGSALGGIGGGRPSLYEDEGHYCFEYRDGDSFFSVRDGIISAVMPPEEGFVVEDCRMFRGEEVLIVRKGPNHYLFQDGGKRKIAQAYVPIGFPRRVRRDGADRRPRR